MLIRILRDALRTLRRAGWPVAGLAALHLLTVAVVLPEPGLLLFIAAAAQNVVTFALVRHLAAHRGIAPKADLPAPTTRAGKPILAWRRPGPLTDADRSARQALRGAAYLARPAMRLALVQIVMVLAMVTVLFAFAGDSLNSGDPPTHAQIVRLLAGAVPLAALFAAFIAVAPARIAIEGDHRVVLAAIHSIRIARTSYGPMFVFALVEPLMAFGFTALRDRTVAQIALIAAYAPLHLVVVAALNEVYAAGPALVPPGAQRAPRD